MSEEPKKEEKKEESKEGEEKIDLKWPPLESDPIIFNEYFYRLQNGNINN